MLALIKRNWIMYKRYFPVILFINRILDSSYKILSIWLITFVLFDGGKEVIIKSTNVPYFSYALTGIIFLNLCIATIMNISRSLITEVREGTLVSLLLTPYNIFTYFLGVFIEQLPRTLLEFGIILILSLIINSSLLNISFWAWIIGIILFLYVCFCLGVFLANVMLQLRDTYVSQNTLFILIMLLCGITFPISVLPNWLSFLSNLLPITQALEFFRTIAFTSTNFYLAIPTLLQCIALSTLYLGMSLIWFKKTERKIIAYIFD